MSVLRLLQEPPATYPRGRILWQGEDILRMDAPRLRRLRGGEAGHDLPGADDRAQPDLDLRRPGR